jgi:hypothetical protein
MSASSTAIRTKISANIATSLLKHTQNNPVESERSQSNARYGSGPWFAKGKRKLRPA